MKHKIYTLFLPLILTSCNSQIIRNTIAVKSTTGYINSLYSTGREITWKGDKKVVSVHDGDTITTAFGEHWRVFGIDTPELSIHDKGTNKWKNTIGLELLWAKKAREFVKKKILYQPVTIISNHSKTYNRTVASIYYLNKNHKAVNLAFELIKQGLARKGYITTKRGKYHVPNAYYNYISSLQRASQKSKRGLWKYNLNDQHIIFPKWGIQK